MFPDKLQGKTGKENEGIAMYVRFKISSSDCCRKRPGAKLN